MHNQLGNREIYVIFYTSLLDSQDSRNGKGYKPSLFDALLQDNDHYINRICNYISPPFSGCKLAVRRQTGFESYGFVNDKFTVQSKTFLHRPGFCLLRLLISQYQMQIIDGLLKKFISMKDSVYLSYLKMTAVKGKLRQYACMGPPSYPDLSQKDWTCSELITFVFQQAGVLNRSSVHPTYTSPTNLFYELLDSHYIDYEGSYNPFFTNNYTSPLMTIKNTNAYLVYCSVMGIEDKLEIERAKEDFMQNCLCKRFRIDTVDINQYSMMKMMSDKNFNLDDYLGIKETIKEKVIEVKVKEAPKLEPVRYKPFDTPVVINMSPYIGRPSYATPLYA